MAVAITALGTRVTRLQRLRVCSAEVKPLAEFYESALGFRRVAFEHLSGSWSQEQLSVGGRVWRITLELGAQRVELLQFVDRPGRPYPTGSHASDTVFQHFAIVVADMNAAMAQLSQSSQWTPITIGGPQQLPSSSGGVTAFKFRDPEGHPIELLAFPPGQVPAYWQHAQGDSPFLGIDHSAISVADTDRSIAFYASLGLTLSHRSINHGAAQARLDGLGDPLVEVSALTVTDGTPHLELLDYRGVGERAMLDLAPNDVAATCLIFERDRAISSTHVHTRFPINLVDPDGHLLSVVMPNG